MPLGEPRRRLAGRLSGDDAFRPPTLPCAPPHPPALAALNHVLWNTARRRPAGFHLFRPGADIREVEMLNHDGDPTELVGRHVRGVLQQLACRQRELQRCRVERSMTPTMLPYAIETAARADHERLPLLLYCPSEGCWHTGVWWQGAWRLKGDVERVLNPTHWLPASTDVVVASDPVERRASTDVVVESDPAGRRAGGGGSSGPPPS
jgi:hypothetical protein